MPTLPEITDLGEIIECTREEKAYESYVVKVVEKGKLVKANGGKKSRVAHFALGL